jgi:putative hydrolase of HD superfamily
MYRMALMTMLASPALASRINIGHCVQMALIHDMAESLVGDITPRDGILKPEKSRREEETMDYICEGLLGKVNGGLNGQQIKKIWREYEDSETPESKFVHDIDKLELMYQMVEYERSHEGKLDLSEFRQVSDRIETDEVKQWCADVLKEREAFWKGVGINPEHDESALHKEQADEYYGKSKE